MRDSHPTTTLWLASEAGHATPEPEDGPGSALSTTLNAELHQLRHTGRGDDVLEVLATCLRQREAARLLLQHRARLWPLTVFPREGLYHLPRPILGTLGRGPRDLSVLAVEATPLQPPAASGSAGSGRRGFRPLPPLLWALAHHLPQASLLRPIRGPAAYRLSPDFAPDAGALDGPLGPALRRLRAAPVALAAMAQWPGMDVERAVRLLNAVYLHGGLMVLRHHPAARTRGALRQGLLGWWPTRRPSSGDFGMSLD